MGSIIKSQPALWEAADSGENSERTSTRALLGGLTQVTPLGAFVCVTVVLLGVVAFLTLATPRVLGRLGRTGLAAHSGDYDAIVTADLHAYLAAPGSELTLVLFGGSTMRASFLEADVVHALHQQGRSARLLKLCTSTQSLWETLALAEHLPARMRGVAAVGVGPSLFSKGPELFGELAAVPRLGLRSAVLDQALESRGHRVGPRTGVYAIDNAAFLVARRQALASRLLGLSPVPYVDSRYTGETKPLTPAAWRKIGARVARRYDVMDANWAGNAVVLTRIVRTLEARGLRVLLVETPVNPRFEDEFATTATAARHRGRVEALAGDLGVPYLHLVSAARLEPDDFHDWAHLRARHAARRCADELAARVRALLGERHEA
ncbi:hypothetical protein TBR22_A11760 [Luteitalea sp. TBR-22]|nr:hypothetical protein TBR22_A11760 [Luteitalea sp. TBR-22]